MDLNLYGDLYLFLGGVVLFALLAMVWWPVFICLMLGHDRFHQPPYLCKRCKAPFNINKRIGSK